MAENVVIAGATYSEVNAMTVPTSNGESVTFVDSELIPTKVSQLENDAGYLTENILPEAINTALEQANRYFRR